MIQKHVFKQLGNLLCRANSEARQIAEKNRVTRPIIDNISGIWKKNLKRQFYSFKSLLRWLQLWSLRELYCSVIWLAFFSVFELVKVYFYKPKINWYQFYFTIHSLILFVSWNCINSSKSQRIQNTSIPTIVWSFLQILSGHYEFLFRAWHGFRKYFNSLWSTLQLGSLVENYRISKWQLA